jgi:hypothetical protein
MARLLQRGSIHWSHRYRIAQLGPCLILSFAALREGVLRRNGRTITTWLVMTRRSSAGSLRRSTHRQESRGRGLSFQIAISPTDMGSPARPFAGIREGLAPRDLIRARPPSARITINPFRPGEGSPLAQQDAGAPDLSSRGLARSAFARGLNL